MIATTKKILYEVLILIEGIFAILFLISLLLFFDRDVLLSEKYKIIASGITFSCAFVCHKIAAQLKK